MSRYARIKYEGTTIGNVEVLNYLGNRKYLCRCKLCGQQFEVTSEALRLRTINKNDKLIRFSDHTAIHMVGQSIGNFDILKYLGNDRFEVRCKKCGNTSTVSYSGVTSSPKYKGYGCSKCCNNVFIDETNKIYGDFFVNKYVGKGKYLCTCTKCGYTKYTLGANLRKEKFCECIKCRSMRKGNELV